MAKDRSPNWAKWKHIPEVMLWQAVALSLDIDPDVADRSYSWKAEATLTGESKAFKDRLDVLLANFDRHSLLKPTSLSLSDRDESTLRIDMFATWAISLDWIVPPQLASMAVETHEPVPASDAIAIWGTVQLWTLLEAAYLLAGAVPPVAVKGTIKFVATPLSDEDLQLESLMGLSARNYRELKDATDLGQLEYFEPRTGSIGNRRVKPSECVAWAMSRGLTVPECFVALAAQAGKRSERPALHPKERESLLKLIIAMAVKAYKYDPRVERSDATRKIADDVGECGLSIDTDTVKKWLDKAAELVSDEAVARLLNAGNKRR